MGQFALREVGLGGPQPVDEVAFYTHRNRFAGVGSPNGRVPGFVGDEFLDISTSEEWHKTSGYGTKTGWDKEGDSDGSETSDRLIEITSADGYELTAINYDSDGVATTATVKWPDGSAGIFTTTDKNDTFLTIDAYTVTHADSGTTVTQSTVTRNAFGQVTVKPALTTT